MDWLPRAEAAWNSRLQLTEKERTDKQLQSAKLFQNTKQLHPPILALEKPKTKDNRVDKADAERKQAEYLKQLANHISQPDNHVSSGLTLIIMNTVDRATKLFHLLNKQPTLIQGSIKLMHSRFRPCDRKQWRDFFGQKDSSRRILVSTQVVEAGVDLSATVLYTELAPWASLVQRFGRCARYPGETGQVFWLNLGLGTTDSQSHWARPYERRELDPAREKLESLDAVGLDFLTEIKTEIDMEQSGEQAISLFPYEPRFVPRDKDLFDLFDTTPDLTGADIDIARYIRDGKELDVQVFWRNIPAGVDPLKKDRSHHDELCPVPFYRFQEVLGALRQAGRIWRRNYRKGWELVDSRNSEQVYPGQVFLLEKSCGGYSIDLGWSGDTSHTNFELPPLIQSQSPFTQSAAQDEEEDAEDLSKISQWLTVLDHTRDVCRKLEDILDSTGLAKSEVKVLRLAARWHDRGKAHTAFIAKLKTDSIATPTVLKKLDGQPAAKARENAWRRDKVRAQTVNSLDDQTDKRRPGFRHELASALAILETLHSDKPMHEAFSWPDGLDKSDFCKKSASQQAPITKDDPLTKELAALTGDEIDLLVYLVAAHHGKVRMSLRSSPDDDRTDVPDPCPSEARQARGVRDGDIVPACQIPNNALGKTGFVAPEVTLSLDMIELGLSKRYGPSWRERMQILLERLGPFRLAYLEALLRAADCRASMEENQRGKDDQ